MPKIIGPPTPRFLLFDAKAFEETYIICYFTFRKGERFKYSTGLKILPENWDFEAQRARVGKRFNANNRAEINKRLEDIVRHCKDILRERGKRVSLDFFREELNFRLEADAQAQEDAENPPTLLEFAERYVKQTKPGQNVKGSTLRNYPKALRHLQNYAAEKRRTLEFSEITVGFFDSFRQWLYAPPRSHSTNTANRTIKFIKEIVRAAEAKNLHTNRAYLAVKISNTPVSKITLSFDELDGLAALDLSGDPRLERVRDLLLIGCYTGLRFSDFSRISPEHVRTHEGQKLIGITTVKTAQMVYVPLHPTLDKILKKYGYRSPRMSNQKLNAYLKELGRLAGMTREVVVNDATGGKLREKTVQKWELLTTHVGRRSFASNYYQKYPHLINEIMAITGHATEAQFRAYIVTDALEQAVRFAKGIS